MIISNTSPLIHLAKIGKLILLKKCFKTVLIPKSVFNEILKQQYSTHHDGGSKGNLLCSKTTDYSWNIECQKPVDCCTSSNMPPVKDQWFLTYPRSSEAILLKKAVKEKWIKINEIKINEILKEFNNIAKTELEVISLALKEKKKILMDDQSAVKIANLFDLKVYGTLYVIIKSVKLKLLNKTEAVDIVNKMINNELYLSSDVYALFLEKLKNI